MKKCFIIGVTVLSVLAVALAEYMPGGGGGGAAQTPWTSNIDGDGYNLSGVGDLTVTNDVTVGNDILLDGALDFRSSEYVRLVGINSFRFIAGAFTAVDNKKMALGGTRDITALFDGTNGIIDIQDAGSKTQDLYIQAQGTNILQIADDLVTFSKEALFNADIDMGNGTDIRANGANVFRFISSTARLRDDSAFGIGTSADGIWEYVTATDKIVFDFQNAGTKTQDFFITANTTNIAQFADDLVTFYKKVDCTTGLNLPSNQYLTMGGVNVIRSRTTGPRFLDGIWAAFGTADDATLSYDGTDLILNTRNAGTGNLVVSNGTIVCTDMPTATNGLPSGALWSDSGTLKIMP